MGAVGFVLLCALIGCYYAFLLGNGHFVLLAREKFDMVFGSMLEHLLRGEFDVDSDAIGDESFTHGGKAYAYFGPFPAALRLLAMPFIDVKTGGLARLSCLLAMLAYVIIQLRTLFLVHGSVPAPRRSGFCLTIMVLAISLSGPQLYLLGSAWIYHEPVFWAGAMGALYNLIVLRGVLAERPFRAVDLCWLALIAGLALNTRVSVGIALCLSTSLLVLWRAWNGRADSGAIRSTAFWGPVLILALFVIIVGTVNFGRWGNPLTFADLRYWDFGLRLPRRMDVVRNYGELNALRIPIDWLYYATGIPYAIKTMQPFAGYFDSHFDGFEAPAFSAMAVNPLIVILAGIGVFHVIRRPDSLPAGSAPLLRLTLVGHFAAIVLVCAAMYSAMRYRMDFAPFMTLAAFVGYPAVMRASFGPERRRVIGYGIALCLFGIVASHYVLLIHKVWSTGVPYDVRERLQPYVAFSKEPLEH